MNRNLAWTGALVEELARCGVRHVCVSPGSRSAPLTLSFAAHPGIHDRSLLDERSAAFFALGLARASHSPVALVCTSGTAAANFLPAIIEAHQSQVPLVVLTADRPPQEQGCGAPQTIEQQRLYGSYVRFYAELPTPDPQRGPLLHLRRTVCQALAAARGGPPGPVHLNLPLPEPLAPIEVPEDIARIAALDELPREGRDPDPMTRVIPPQPPQVSEREVEQLARRIRRQARGWLVVGPLDAAPDLASELARLAQLAGWPVLADPLSQLRGGPHDRGLLVEAYDAVLRTPGFREANLPRLVLRFGALPTSKASREVLERHPEITQIVVDPWGWSDPTAGATELVRSDPLLLARALVRSLESFEPSERSAPVASFAQRWTAAGRRAWQILDSSLSERATLSEPGVVRTLASSLPEGATLFVASSMPVRDVDLLWPSTPRSVRILANRGANGIDGTLSSALGTAVGCGGPLVLLIGDLALLHDWNGLLASRAGDIDATVVVLDNDGGGIFEFLPVASLTAREVFERHFGTPQGVDLPAALAGFGLPCRCVDTEDALREALAASLKTPGVQFVWVPSDRRENLELHHKLMEAVTRGLAPETH